MIIRYLQQKAMKYKSSVLILYQPKHNIKCTELMIEHKLVEIFVSCDDFYKEFEKFLSDKGLDDDPLKKTLV